MIWPGQIVESGGTPHAVSESNSRDRGRPLQQAPDLSAAARPDAKVVIVTGTIIRNGGDYVLRDWPVTVFRLHSPEKDRPFEGRPVKVSREVEAKTNLLHLDRIKALNA